VNARAPIALAVLLVAVLVAGSFSFATAWAMSSALVALFPPEALGPSASEAVFDGSRTPQQIAWLAVVAAPLYETLLAQAVPLEIAQRLRLPWAWGIGASAAVFGLAHWLGGGVGHGLVTLFMGAVFAAMYAAFRGALDVPGFGRGGPFAGYAAAAGTHAVHNALALAIVH
jgi:hypothetical protein